MLVVAVDLQQAAGEAAAPVVGRLPVGGLRGHVVARAAHSRVVHRARLCQTYTWFVF